MTILINCFAVFGAAVFALLVVWIIEEAWYAHEEFCRFVLFWLIILGVFLAIGFLGRILL